LQRADYPFAERDGKPDPETSDQDYESPLYFGGEVAYPQKDERDRTTRQTGEQCEDEDQGVVR
jgi:hypothetical protein